MMNHDEVTPGAYYARVRGVVSERLSTRHVLVAGAGGGSASSIILARTGVGTMTFIDRQVVEVENLARTAFTVHDLGRPKAEALAEHVQLANSLVQVRGVHADLCELDLSNVDAVLAGVDLIVAGTDSFEAQALLNRWSCDRGIPAVFIGVHERAKGGMIIWSIPGETACYRCMAKTRYEAHAGEAEPRLDLDGARGCMVDVGFIDAIATKIVLAILERAEVSDAADFFEHMKERTQVVVRTHPNYRWDEVDLFDLILSDLPTEPSDYKKELQREAFLAMDSLWLRTERDPACPDCSHLFTAERSS